MIRTFRHDEFDAHELAAAKDGEISVVLPARDEEQTIGAIVTELRTLGGLIDEIVVIDGGSTDRTAELASAAGAQVHARDRLVREAGPAHGKGDGMWRSLAVARGDYLVYLDADTRGFAAHFAVGLIGALLADDGVQFVKGAYRRPFNDMPDEGGRVTELCARPLLAAFYPPLAEFRQPLAGEIAARRALLERLPFHTGYGVEIGMLIDVYERVGLDGMAQVDLGERRNRHRPLLELAPMAYTVMSAVLVRLQRAGRVADEELLPLRAPDGSLYEPQLLERPPFAPA